MKQIGRYRLDGVQGFGAFAMVWRGFDPELEIPVAVKILAENWAHHADVRERFLSEARLLRKIDSPRVIRVYDIGTHEERPYFVMDFIDGGTVADRVKTPVPTEQALKLAVDSARAVQVLHDAGVLHRDIKPTNLLVGEGERVLVADLGSAKRLAEASGVTVTTGTPAYMAPEQARGEAVDARSDVYALGAVTYELLSGKQPFNVSDPGSLLKRTPDTRPPRLDGAGSRALDRVLASALATRPADRPVSAAAFADALEQVAAGTKAKDVKRLRRQISPAVLTTLAMVIFGASAAATWFLLR
ncbi:serine/threonine protein kinase [Aeromicrobium panaciterrae]|uniref:non-specific serine/threonine protein kinase n=1 Tax=Aeromicrobium panaciterrae TaxID=363861 RepID=A0ABU1UKW8_9ACTN|nr:serine/threonine-protein kinase [Aeromicrobium panaciterrae]MDR7085804.1 serine/threonine protein kinase [Aeromicrobium panaciterrae]